MKRLIIADIKSPVFEGKSSGHFFAVAHNYYELFQGSTPTKIAGGPIYSSLFPYAVLPLPENVDIQKDGRLQSVVKYFRNARKLFQACSDDVIVVQQGGDITFFIACTLFYRKAKNNKLFLIQYSTAAISNRVGRLFYKIAKRKLDGIICPNHEVGEMFARPYCVVPDYIFNGNHIQCPPISYDEKIYDICFLGRIVVEKGIDEFLSKFVGAPYRMLVAGRVDNPCLEKKLQDIVKGHDNIQLCLEFLSREDYQKYLYQSRFCVLNYKGEYSRRSSGVVLDMIFNDVPVIGLECKALEFVKQNGLGYIYSNLASLNLAEVITSANYNHYVSQIARYKQSHMVFKHQLGKFLAIDTQPQ